MLAYGPPPPLRGGGKLKDRSPSPRRGSVSPASGLTVQVGPVSRSISLRRARKTLDHRGAAPEFQGVGVFGLGGVGDGRLVVGRLERLSADDVAIATYEEQSIVLHGHDPGKDQRLTER